jgi:hypothetical protein
MSGGHYNYKCFVINDLAQEIDGDIRKHSKAGRDRYDEWDAFSPATIKYMKETVRLLKKASKMAYNVEWFMSGDYGEDDLK